MHIIVTGFGLYGGYQDNSSSLAVHRLKEIWDDKYLNEYTTVKLSTVENVPVTYRAVDECVNSIWRENPSYSRGYDKPDMDGSYCENDGCASTYGKPILYCNMNLSKVYGKLMDNHVACSISSDPGRFLCGYMYYKSLEYSPDRVVFVHVPCLTRMSADNIAMSLLQIICELAALKGVIIP
ncbi:Pyroglutamyl-peptidase 1 [Schistosoma japonicum]|nr:Pyroglutamyl-peptidase 1 [Schistosoma japonicum]KAH8853718.1 Pyroglutamyl-peptidase 1 [Schistosoma japonicum]